MFLVYLLYQIQHELEHEPEAAREAVLMGSYAYDVKASFQLADGWFKPIDLFFEKRDREDIEEYHAWFDFSDYAGDTELAMTDEDRRWIDISADEVTTVEGYLDMITERVDTGNYLTMRFPDRLGPAMICHAVEVWYDSEPPLYEGDYKPVISIKVRLDGDRLVFDEGQ